MEEILNRYSKVLTHTLCPEQLAGGDDRRITHGICQARDAVYAAGMRREGCGLADNNFEAAFDFLCLDWVRKVLKKKRLADAALGKFMNFNSSGITNGDSPSQSSTIFLEDLLPTTGSA